MMVADFGAAQAAEIAFRPIRASAVQAVGFLVIDPLHFKAARADRSTTGASSAFNIVPFSTRDLIHESAAPSERNTAGKLLPLRSRTMTTAWRLPDLVAQHAAVLAILANVRGLHVTAEIRRHPFRPPCLRRRSSRPRISSAIASRILWHSTKAAL